MGRRSDSHGNRGRGHTVSDASLDPDFARHLEAYEERKRREREEQRRVVKMPIFSIQRDEIGGTRR